MKKKFAVLAAVVLSAAMMAGCGSSAGNSSASANSKEEISLADLDISKFVTLGDYKGLSVTVDDTSVSENEVDLSVQSALVSRKVETEVKDRPVQEGDIVNIDYVGKKDGVAFDGGTGEGYDLTIGSGTFIEGFEDGLIGAETGEKRTLNLTFPEEYHSEELAGEDVTFDVTVNSIKEESYHELPDELAHEINPDVETVEEFRDRIRERIVKEKRNSAQAAAYGKLMEDAMNNAVIAKAADLPKDLLDQTTLEEKENFAMTLQLYGMELKDYLEQQGLSEEDFDKTVRDYAAGVLQQELLITALAEAEGIEVTQEDMDAAYEEKAADYGYDSGENFRKSVEDSNTQDTFRNMLLAEKVQKMLFDNARVSNPEAVNW